MGPAMPELDDRPWVLVDGACGFCRRAASWARRQPGGEGLRFVAFQQVEAPWLDEALREACAEALHLRWPDGRLLRGAPAVAAIARALGWQRLGRPLAGLRLALAERAYAWVAGHRSWVSRVAFTSAADDEDLKAPAEQLGQACGWRAPKPMGEGGLSAP